MTSREETNLDTVRRYFESLSSGRIGADLSDLFTPDVVQEEFPNRLMPQGATRDLAAMREGAERGHAFMKDQQFQLRFAIFFEFREGKIARQRNYDCFDPW